MSLDKFNPAVWQRFNELAAMSDTDREEIYRLDGMSFVSSLITSFMKGSAIPEIDCAEEFSEFIIESRENYRLWNQRLMSLMIAFKADAPASDAKLLHDFAATCPWTELVEAAQDFVASS